MLEILATLIQSCNASYLSLLFKFVSDHFAKIFTRILRSPPNTIPTKTSPFLMNFVILFKNTIPFQSSFFFFFPFIFIDTFVFLRVLSPRKFIKSFFMSTASFDGFSQQVFPLFSLFIFFYLFLILRMPKNFCGFYWIKFTKKSK